jgi:hypothetical protein
VVEIAFDKNRREKRGRKNRKDQYNTPPEEDRTEKIQKQQGKIQSEEFEKRRRG